MSVFCLTWVGTVWGQECRIDTTPMSFGAYNPFSSAPLDATATVRVTCDVNLPFTVKMDPGKSLRRSFDPREMSNSSGRATLRYNLFIDSARTQIWGDGTGRTLVKTGRDSGAPFPFTVHGRIPARQNVPVGFYSDRVNVVVEW